MNGSFAIVAVLAASVSACTRAPDTNIELVVDSSDAAVVAETLHVLMERFDEHYPGKAVAHVDGSVIMITFTHFAPDPEVVRYCYSTPGRVRADLAGPSTPNRGAILFSEREIADASVSFRNARPALNIRLTQAGGERMQRLTTRNIGGRAQLLLDNRVLYQATIATALRDSFSIEPDMEVQPMKALAVILRSGALPAHVSERAR